jgi:hypothetical protein
MSKGIATDDKEVISYSGNGTLASALAVAAKDLTKDSEQATVSYDVSIDGIYAEFTNYTGWAISVVRSRV